jgi:hypothetical protein
MDSVPVFDGMAGAYGKVYVSMADGTLRCLGKSGRELDPIPETSIAAFNADAPVINQPKKPPRKKPNVKQ